MTEDTRFSCDAADSVRRQPALSRRGFCAGLGMAAAASVFGGGPCRGVGEPGFRLRYILASSMYGYTNVRDILPEIKKAGATAIDLPSQPPETNSRTWMRTSRPSVTTLWTVVSRATVRTTPAATRISRPKSRALAKVNL